MYSAAIYCAPACTFDRWTSVAVHAARRSLPLNRPGPVGYKKHVLVQASCTRSSLALASSSPSLSLFFVLFISLLLCPSFILSPSSCLTLDRFLPLYASSPLDNHNPCSSSSRYSLLRQQLWVGKTETSTQPVKIENQLTKPSRYHSLRGRCGSVKSLLPFVDSIVCGQPRYPHLRRCF